MTGADRDVVAARRALARVTRAVRRRDSVMAAAAWSLPLAHRRLFAASYASMRVIDDFVDADFMALPRNERAVRRDAARRHLADWCARAEAALAGDFVARGDDASDSVFLALAHTAGSSGIDAGPWRALATAMARDIDELRLQSWDDFLVYSAGAAVAPAEVYVHLLGSESDGSDGLRYRLAQPATAFAANLARFCYLVHILRDLPLDLDRDAQLVTLPRQELARHGLDLEDLAAAVARGTDPDGRAVGDGGAAFAGLLAEICERAAAFERDAAVDLDAFEAAAPPARARLLRGLADVYRGQFARLRRDPFAVWAQRHR